MLTSVGCSPHKTQPVQILLTQSKAPEQSIESLQGPPTSFTQFTKFTILNKINIKLLYLICIVYKKNVLIVLLEVMLNKIFAT